MSKLAAAITAIPFFLPLSGLCTSVSVCKIVTTGLSGILSLCRLILLFQLVQSLMSSLIFFLHFFFQLLEFRRFKLLHLSCEGRFFVGEFLSQLDYFSCAGIYHLLSFLLVCLDVWLRVELMLSALTSCSGRWTSVVFICLFFLIFIVTWVWCAQILLTSVVFHS